MKLKFILSILLFAFSTQVNCQNYNLRAFNGDQGLPDAYIYSTIQSNDGMLWISTSKGLVYFDGQTFTKIELDTIRNDFIFSSAVSRDGDLWFGSFTGKMYKVNSSTLKVESIPFNTEGTIHKIISSQFSNQLYFLSIGNGIYTYNQNKFAKLSETENFQINDFVELENGNIILCSSEGLLIYNQTTNHIEQIKNTKGYIKQIQKLTSEKNTYLLFQEERGILKIRFNVQDNSVLSSERIILNVSILDVSSFFFDEINNSIFIGSKDEKLIIVDLSSQQTNIVEDEKFSGSITHFFKDNETNIWIGTNGKGLFRVLKSDFDVYRLNGETIFSICEDEQKQYYYGTKKGIVVCNNINQEVKRITKIGTIELGKVNSLYFDGENLWIGLENQGLIIINPKTLQQINTEFSSIQNISVNSIGYNTFDNQIQVNTNLEGVFIYEGLKLKHHFSVQNSLLHNNVYHSIKNENNKTYYATHNTAFNISSKDSIYEFRLSDQNLIADFNAFANLSKGHIAVATSGDGVYFINDSSIVPFALNNQLNSKFCNGIVKDKLNNLWITQQYDLYHYHTKENVLKRINLTKVGPLIFNDRAIFENANHDLFFGTNGQLIVFKNNQLYTPGKVPVPRITKIFVNDSLYKIGDDFHLNHGKFNFHFEYSALSLKNSEEVKFSYLLDGRDLIWSEPSASRVAYFSNLSDGDYIFKVIAYNCDGFPSKKIAQISFHIDQPFWKNKLFWLITSLFLVIAIYLIINIRTKALVQRNKKLETMVEEKTSELREEKKLVEDKNKLIEEQNEEIKSSITYAKRIQDAILPDKNIFIERSDKIFIFYHPRDIVSGDFYWLTEIGELKIIVVADCTGHGVPGAFMSMIGNTLLNKIILERHITQPAEILFALDDEIRVLLKQHTRDATRDGMDMAICALNRNTNQLLYSGAMRPLLFIRNGQLQEFEATKHAIGGYNYGLSRAFNQHEIKCEKDDMFYIFSDGYADQFGGEKGKKFMLKNFKQLLSDISNESLNKQETLIKNNYHDWKGSLEQIDDVCVIGVRV